LLACQTERFAMLRRCVPLRCEVVTGARAAAAKLLAASGGTFGVGLLEVCAFDGAAVRRAAPPRDACLVFPFTVAPGVTNAFGTMHGGNYAALADVFTSLHLWGMAADVNHVSTAFSIDYMAAAPAGGRVECVTTVVKRGRSVGFTKFEFVLVGADGKRTLCATGTHTKSMIQKR
jgi:acyl-coenzyme A thioesterase 13